MGVSFCWLEGSVSFSIQIAVGGGSEHCPVVLCGGQGMNARPNNDGGTFGTATFAMWLTRGPAAQL